MFAWIRNKLSKRKQIFLCLKINVCLLKEQEYIFTYVIVCLKKCCLKKWNSSWKPERERMDGALFGQQRRSVQVELRKSSARERDPCLSSLFPPPRGVTSLFTPSPLASNPPNRWKICLLFSRPAHNIKRRFRGITILCGSRSWNQNVFIFLIILWIDTFAFWMECST